MPWPPSRPSAAPAPAPPSAWESLAMFEGDVDAGLATPRRRTSSPGPGQRCAQIRLQPAAGGSGAALGMAGLDPHVGFLHGEDQGRPSLALDLVEEFRPLVV